MELWLLASLYRWQKSWNKSWNKKPTFLTFIMVVSSLILTTKNLNTTLTVWASSSTNSCTLNTPFFPIQSSKCRLLHRTSKNSPVLLNFSSHKNLHWKISNKKSKSARTSRHKSKTTKKYCNKVKEDQAYKKRCWFNKKPTTLYLSYRTKLRKKTKKMAKKGVDAHDSVLFWASDQSTRTGSTRIYTNRISALTDNALFL